MPTAEEIKQSLLGLDPNSRYAVRVRAVDGLGNKSDWSEALEFDTTGSDSRPSKVYGVSWDWTNRDLIVSWQPVTTNQDGSLADVAYYEFTAVLGGFSPEVLITKKHVVHGTEFTYTAEQILNDYDGPPGSVLFFYVSAVSISGMRSIDRFSSEGEFLSAVTPVSHNHDDEVPRAPSLYTLANGDILVAMDRGERNCHDYWGDVLVSDDGGSSWHAFAEEVHEPVVVYHATEAKTYYFRYKRFCIFNESTEYSNAEFSEARNVWTTLTTSTDDFSGSNLAKVRFTGPIWAADGIGTAVIKVNPSNFPVSDYCSVTVKGLYEFKFPMKQGDTHYTITLPAEEFEGSDVDFDFFLDGEVGGHAEVKLTLPK